jgi:hypothetical protein
MDSPNLVRWMMLWMPIIRMINNNPPNPRDNFCRSPSIRLPPFNLYLQFRHWTSDPRQALRAGSGSDLEFFNLSLGFHSAVYCLRSIVLLSESLIYIANFMPMGFPIIPYVPEASSNLKMVLALCSYDVSYALSTMLFFNYFCQGFLQIAKSKKKNLENCKAEGNRKD